MKTVLCIFLLTILHQYDCKPTATDMQLSESLCLQELHLKSSDVPDIGNFQKDSEDNTNNRKMFACLFSKMGILDDEQKISEDGFDNFVDVLVGAIKGSEQAEKITRDSLHQCREIEGRSGGEVGLKLRNCLKRAGMEAREKFQKANSLV